jgi:hypothetical protein
MVRNKEIFDGQRFYSKCVLLGGAVSGNLRGEIIIFLARPARAALQKPPAVVPAKAGTHAEAQNSVSGKSPGHGRNTTFGSAPWIPAFARTTVHRG